jgi:hypothetical protein
MTPDPECLLVLLVFGTEMRTLDGLRERERERQSDRATESGLEKERTMERHWLRH